MIGAAASAALGLERRGWPPDYWTDKGSLLGWCLLAVAALPIFQRIAADIEDWSEKKALNRSREIEDRLVTTLVQACTDANADWRTTGIQAFLVQRKWFRWRGRPWTEWWRPYEYVQVRVGGVRMQPSASSGVKWTKGKGLIGRCWDTHLPQCQNLGRHFARHLTCTESSWAALSDAERFGLSYSDFKRLGKKYGIVAAAPIVVGGEYKGCVTADSPPGVQPKCEKLKEVLAVPARIIADMLKA